VSPIQSERRESSTARVPAVSPGRAIIVTRYDEEKAVILNPEDFHRLVALEDALEEIVLADRPRMSEPVLEAHRIEDEPSGALEDAAGIKALLGL